MKLNQNEYCHVKVCCTDAELTQHILDAINTVVLDYTRDNTLFYSTDTTLTSMYLSEVKVANLT